MKNRRNKRTRLQKYKKLKLSIMLRALLVTAITGVIGTLVMVYFVDGFLGKVFPKAFAGFLGIFGVGRADAFGIYSRFIGENRPFIALLIFLVLFFIVFYLALSSIAGYFEDIEKCIENIDNGIQDPVHLIDELKPVEDKLNSLKSNLSQRTRENEESEKKKSDLILFLAHDLKTPLTSIIAYLTRLDADPEMDKEERVKYIHIALEKSIRLNELIREFFEIARFNLNKIELSKEVINLSMMLEQLSDELYAVLAQKRMTCEVHTDEDIMIYGDPDKLARVFDNVLRNAVNYSVEGGEVEIEAAREDGWVVISIRNEGLEIPEQELARIFQKFYRLDAARSSRTGGAGLGLAIAKEIVEAHGGAIRAESNGRKTAFVISLPARD
ncbi:MAG: ATP-binding protein, partial [Clostridiales bacterium]|nr:ATP-binding protein [Clostridiales bacterium]